MRLPWVTRKQAEAEIARQRQEAVVREQALREQVAREQSARILTAFLPDGMSAEGWIRATTSPEFTDDQQYRMGVGELMRASFAQSAMPGVPTQLSPTNSPYPVYQFNQPYAFAVPQPPYRPPGQTIPVSVDTLRQLADLYPVARACINHIKRELWAQPLSLGLRDSKDRSPASATALGEAKAWFSRKGGLGGIGRHRRVFESMVIEDLCVIGASCTYYAPSRGGRPYEALAIDASTIRPKTDAFGHRGPGAHWYEQWIYGVKVGDYGNDEMTYDGLYQLSYTPYPKSPVEYLVWIIDTGLRSMDWNRRWFTDGDSPTDRVALPQNWTFEQTLSYMEYVRGLYAGNSALRQMTRYLPGGSAALAGGGRKDQDFEQFELDTARKCGALFGVQLASLGFMGEQYKVSQENSIEATTNVGMAPYRLYLKDQYDEVLERMGLSEAVECKFMEEAEEDAASRTERLLKATGAPWKTINEARQEDGDLDPVDDGDDIIVSSMTIPLSQLLNPPPEAAGPAAGAPMESAERPSLERNDRVPDGRTPEQRAAYLRDLDVWQASALEQLARGERILMQPVRTIRAEEHGTLVGRLLAAANEDDVRWAFGAARVIETLLRAESGEHWITTAGGRHVMVKDDSSDRPPIRTIAEHIATGKDELGPSRTVAYRVGKIHDDHHQGPFGATHLGDSPASISAYATERPDRHSQIKEHVVSTRRTAVFDHQVAAYQHVFGKSIHDDQWKVEKKSGFKITSPEARAAMEKKLHAKLRAQGYDSVIYRKPPAPAIHELALLGKTAVIESSRVVKPGEGAAEERVAFTDAWLDEQRAAGPAPSGGGDQPHFVTIGGKVIPIGQQRPGSGSGRTPAARSGERPGVRDPSQLRRPNYHRATDAERKLHKIPPAGQHAEVSDDPNHHLLATWIDAKGKEQSRYSAAHDASQAALKFNRVRQFNEIVGDVQAKMHAEIEGNGPNKEEASVLRLIHHTAARVGTAEETGGAKKAYGASTLLAKHVHTDARGNVRLSYTGKKGVKQEHIIEDPAIADDIKQRATAAGGPEGRLFNTKDKKVLDYVKKVAGDFKTHDFRTWNATATARNAVMSMPAPTTKAEFDTARKQVGEIAAKKLGDTRDVALDSYVDPLVFHEWGQGLKG